MINDHDQKKPLTIMVVEDNLGDFVLVEDYLLEKFNAIKVNHFIDFKSVSEYFLQDDNNCDLILLDLHLSDYKGIDLINNILAQKIKCPIIIMTGYADIPLAKESLAMGIYDFLIKDEINPALLHKSVEFAISRSKYVGHIENQNDKLKNIAWTQSHVLRAPLSRILGMIHLIENFNDDFSELPFWLDQLKISSHEMDDIIHHIVEETQTLNLK